MISTIHVIDFFELSNPYWLAVTLAVGFEVGAAASLASLVILKKMNKKYFFKKVLSLFPIYNNLLIKIISNINIFS